MLGRIWGPLLIVYVVWGSTYLAIRVAVETIPPFLMASARFLIGGGVLYLVAAPRGDREGDPIGRPQWFGALVVGGLLLFVGNGGVSWAEQRVPIGVTALMIATIPAWMVLAAWMLDRERVRLGTVAGLALGFGGTVLLIRTGGRVVGRSTRPAPWSCWWPRCAGPRGRCSPGGCACPTGRWWPRRWRWYAAASCCWWWGRCPASGPACI